MLSMSKPFFPTALVLAKKLLCPTTSKTRTHVHYTRHAEQSPGGEALLGVMDVKHEENKHPQPPVKSVFRWFSLKQGRRT